MLTVHAARNKTFLNAFSMYLIFFDSLVLLPVYIFGKSKKLR